MGIPQVLLECPLKNSLHFCLDARFCSKEILNRYHTFALFDPPKKWEI